MIVSLQDIQEDSLKTLSDTLRQKKENEKVKVYVFSDGWKAFMIQPILELLHEYIEDVELVGQRLLSAAYIIFRDYKWKKSLATPCVALLHVWRADYAITYKKRFISEMDDFFHREERYEYKFPELTKKEQQYIEQGWDVYLSRKRLASIFKLNA